MEASMQGRRVHDKAPHELEAGDYGRWIDDGNWYAVPPANPDLIANLAKHTVIEHEDATITVSPSILVSAGSIGTWHGFLEHGVWRQV